MLVAYWIVAGLLALFMLFAGGSKLLQPKEKLRAQMAWVEDFSVPVVKLIGAAEVLGAIGLVAPALTGILPVLAPIAAIALGILQIGALFTHVRRSERQMLPINGVLILMCAAAAVLGFLALV